MSTFPEVYFVAVPEHVVDAIPTGKGLYHGVLNAIVRLANNFGYECSPTLQEIRTIAQVSEQVIRECLRWMVRMGFLRIRRSPGDASGRRFEFLWRRIDPASSPRRERRAARPVDLPFPEPESLPVDTCALAQTTPPPSANDTPLPIREKERKTSDVRDGDVSLSLNGGTWEPTFNPTPDEIATWERERSLPGHRGVMAKLNLAMVEAARRESKSPPPAPALVTAPPRPQREVVPPAAPKPAPAGRIYRDERYPATRAIELISRVADPTCPEAVDQAARYLAKRWRDEKPETLSHFAGVFDAARQGLIGSEDLEGLFKDADRLKIQRPANHFACWSGRVLADARRMKKPGLGPLAKVPQARPQRISNQ